MDIDRLNPNAHTTDSKALSGLKNFRIGLLALRCNIEYIASPVKTSTARREQARSLHPILVLCHEKGRQLKDDHPNSHYLQLRVDILVKMISEMSVEELGSEAGETFILSPINPPFENPLSRERGNEKE
ncbi:hypothetical protein [Komagataeibacter sp. FNDCF1]|uniref:hypothetical protein n=1 Tax=Komagataeibacter sp. FNDCF1 TaxID=2878681 RepID=UPI001E5AD29E|nr:hypothetical protein [Komagataeibacter sp. FNDCF1]MCE2566310.1 hypothetical protein [Komagataeibacter sp. FNDCF1]